MDTTETTKAAAPGAGTKSTGTKAAGPKAVKKKAAAGPKAPRVKRLRLPVVGEPSLQLVRAGLKAMVVSDPAEIALVKKLLARLDARLK